MHAETWNIRVRPEVRVQIAPTRYRVPDVAILDASLPREPIATQPPLAVFEVLSSEDTYKRLLRKLHDYAEIHIPGIFVIDPDTGSIKRFEQSSLAPCRDFYLPQSGITFPFTKIANLVR